MSRKATLPTVLKNLYAENSRFDVGPPAYILKELDQNVLALSDIEISDDDVPLLCRFFNHPQACKLIKRVQIDRTSSKKVHVRRPDSAFTSNGCKLMKELFKFIANAKALQSVSFESLEIPVEALPLLGKSLVASSSEIMWLGIKDCSIGGDEGMRILTHYIGKLKLQVLAIEQCELTDASLVYIASILKAQQNNLDSLYWNATLRVDPSKRGALWNASEIDAVYRCGLVALSLYGNNLELRDVYPLTRVLRYNHWLLGLNLANNNIGRESMVQFTDEIRINSVLQTVLLKDNPGLDVEIASNLHANIQSNTVDVTTDTTRDVVEDLELRHSSGYRRLELQTPRIALLLRTWQQLQNIETSVPQVAYPRTHAAAASTTSAATMGSNSPTAMAVRVRKGIKAAAAAKGGSATKAAAPKAGTRRAFEAELHAHLSNPYGYSALDLANDQAPSAPVSPYRQSKNGNFSFASFLDNGFSPAVSGLKMGNGDRAQGQPSPRDDHNASQRSFMSDGEAVDLNASTSRFNIADFHQPVFDSTGPTKKNILSDSIQLSIDSRDDAAGEDHSQHRDTLDLAIPTVSPVKNNSTGATPQSEYYIGMDSKNPSKSLLSFVQSEMQAQAKHDLAEMQTREEAWGNIEWPVSDDQLDRVDSDDALQSGRPPSRISIRRRGSGSSNGRSPSPTHERVDEGLEREYRRRMQQLLQEESAYAARRQSPTHRRPASAPDTRQSTIRGNSFSQPNYLRHTNASVAAGSKPFYAGGQARPSSPPKFSREELAKMYGLIPYGRPEEKDRRHSSPAVVHRKKVVKRRRSVLTVPKRDASPSALGKARGSVPTRIRARSAERSGSAGRGGDVRLAHGRLESSRSSANRDEGLRDTGHGGVRRSVGDDNGVRDSVRVINELSATVLNATRNLETVSTKLKDVIEGLSTSMDMNLTIQRELLSGSIMNATMGGSVGGGGMNASRAWASPAGLSAVHATPMSHSHAHRPISVSGVKASPGDAPSPSSARAAAMRYRDLSSSPVSFNVSAHHHEPDDRHSYHGSNLDGRWDGSRTLQQDDAGLKELIRSRMEQKLRSILEEKN